MMGAQGSSVWHKGGCHCGAVRFEVRAPRRVTVDACNCSICMTCGFLHLITDLDDFRLLKGEESISEYRFNTGVARHMFCRTCGIKSFYIPRSHPDKYSVNFRCVDPSGFDDVTIVPFDGTNWEENVAALRARDDSV